MTQDIISQDTKLYILTKEIAKTPAALTQSNENSLTAKII